MIQSLHELKKPASLLIPYIMKHWKAYGGLFFFIFADTALTLAFAWFLGNITDAAVQQHFDRLKWLIPIGASLTLVSLASNYLHMLVETISSNIIKKDLVEDLFKHILLLSGKHVNRLRTGELMTYFTQDIHGINGMIGSSLIQLVRLPFIFLAVFIYMVHIHWVLSLLSLLVAPVAVLSGALFGILLRRNSRQIHALMEKKNNLLAESFAGMLVVRSFSLEKMLFKRFTEQNEELYRLELEDTKLRGWFRSGGEAAAAAGFLISLSLGAYLVSDQTISIGSLMSFVNLTNHLIYPLTGIAGLWAGFQRSLTAVERISGVLEKQVESIHLPCCASSEAKPLAIEFRDMTFSYDGHKKVFDRFHLQIPAGKTVALVGSSGAGKTTLLHLLQGFYTPVSGNIYIDRIPTDTLTPAQLRSCMAYVPQETFLFSGSVRENLSIARPGITEAEMVRAAVDANIHDFILSLPEGYDTEIGERGMILSGGQKQRISIARAILKDASILLLDEATSALDSETEYQVKEALDRLMANRTTVVIAHRLSTIHNADLIVVLDQGKIIQTGRHEDLVLRQGAYRNLYHRQYFDEKNSIGV